MFLNFLELFIKDPFKFLKQDFLSKKKIQIGYTYGDPLLINHDVACCIVTNDYSNKLKYLKEQIKFVKNINEINLIFTFGHLKEEDFLCLDRKYIVVDEETKLSNFNFKSVKTIIVKSMDINFIISFIQYLYREIFLDKRLRITIMDRIFVKSMFDESLFNSFYHLNNMNISFCSFSFIYNNNSELDNDLSSGLYEFNGSKNMVILLDDNCYYTTNDVGLITLHTYPSYFLE